MMTLQKAVQSTGDHLWSSENEVGSLLAALIDMCKFKTVLESGVFKGRTSCYLVNALPDDGEYTGIDIEDLRPAEVKEFMAPHKMIIGDSRKAITTLPERHYDLIFIDSVHELDFLRVEFRECERVIKTGGIIALHDSIHIPGVKAMVDYLRLFKWFEVVTLPTHDEAGNNRGISLVKCLYG